MTSTTSTHPKRSQPTKNSFSPFTPGALYTVPTSKCNPSSPKNPFISSFDLQTVDYKFLHAFSADNSALAYYFKALYFAENYGNDDMILRSLIELIRVYETYELSNAKCRVTKYYKLDELKNKAEELRALKTPKAFMNDLMKDDEKEAWDIESEFCEDGLDVFESVYHRFDLPENYDEEKG